VCILAACSPVIQPRATSAAPTLPAHWDDLWPLFVALLLTVVAGWA
jgi:hypothetical protein